jgi:predicted Zn-dependent peptidase
MSALKRSLVSWAVVMLAASANVAQAQLKDWPSSRPPDAVASKVTMPPVESRVLPNGLRVVVARSGAQPMVTAQVFVNAGAVHDPAGKAGLASFVAGMLTQGTVTRSGKRLAEELDDVGAEVSATATTDGAFAQVTATADRLSFALDTLADVTCHPAFREEDVEHQRQQLRTALRTTYRDPEYLASAVLERVVFGAHPYGAPTDGTPDSVARMTTDELRDFHQRLYAPGNSILAIVGNIEPAAAFDAAERAFGTWMARESGVPALAAVPEPPKQVVLVDVPDASGAEIRVGQLAVRRRDAAWLPLLLGTRLLGGDGANRLQASLRFKRNVAWDASVVLDAYHQAGIIRAETRTNLANAGTAIRAILTEFDNITTKPADAKELEGIKSFETGSYGFGFETPGSLSTRILTTLADERPVEDLQRYTDAVSAIDAERVRIALNDHLSSDTASIVVVGPASALANVLKLAGFSKILVIRADELDLLAPELKRTTTSATLPRPPAIAAGLTNKANWERARAVLERAAVAAGGLEALRALKTISATSETVIYTKDVPVKALSKTLIVYPNQLRVDAVTPTGALVQAYDAGRAWMWEKRGVRDAPEPLRREFELGLRRDWVRLIVDGLDNRLTGWRVGDETAGSRTLNVVELWADDMPPVRLAIDAASGQLERISYRVPGPFGQETIAESFFDFKPTAGISMPFKAVTRREGMPVLERTVLTIKLNAPIEPGTFDRPK